MNNILDNNDERKVRFILVIKDLEMETRVAKIEAPNLELLLEKVGSLERYHRKIGNPIQSLTIQKQNE